MRWVLAGLAFALLVALAVFTVALRTRNLGTRARIAGHNEQIMSLRVELARRQAVRKDPEHTGTLIDRLREIRALALAPRN